ncbi:universal stress protein UspA [Roseivirga seohaensis]|jgi:nucleotide-binding universal stress UspA family protein|uniref:Universal stress protein UspA n=1 Tax=Roseivirga seohaensis TaxID=1914963 RepID=A0A150XKN4_9BACT|nr:universal stress protein [Roseivirga seohaensis]KYG79297.1 universal stress protein UspA [Roseivirga seohaensis]|tara:strand:- start:483 stop:1316 length:834 start_codon:yes stop_codon:yes gene_type:complete
MKNILVPTDFSDTANRASEIAISIAEKAHAEIHFLHLQVTPLEWVKLDKQKEKRYPHILKQIGHARGELHKWVKKAEERGLVAKDFLVFDVSRDEILKHIPHHHHDFVIMGSNGASGVKELLIGSNAQKILRHTTVPVIIVKERSAWPMQNIVFASSFEEDVQAAFHTVVKFADLSEANIHLLNVNVPTAFEETEKSIEKMKAFHKSCPRKGTCTLNIYNALNEESGILSFAKSVNADLIAMITHGRTGFLNLAGKSIAESVANHSETSLLSLNLKE